MKFDMHLYVCLDCNVTFGVESDYEDQSEITCPACGTDESVADAGGGTFELTREPEGEDE